MRGFFVLVPWLVEQGIGLWASFHGARFTAVRAQRHEIGREGA